MDFDKKYPLVTVFIPSYNHENYISFCIESIVNQAYKNIELIIIDDGSSDNSVEIIENFTDVCKKRFSNFIFINHKNMGLPATTNKALSLAAGKYFSLIASDDGFLPNKIEKQVIFLEKNFNAAAVFGQCYILDSNGLEIGRTTLVKEKCYFSDVILLEHHLKTPSALIRKELLDLVGGYREEVIIEDWYMWLKLTSSGDYYLGAIPDCVAYYRRHGRNTSNNYRLMYSSAMEILNQYNSLDIYEKSRSKLISQITYESSFFEYTYPFILWKSNYLLSRKEKVLQLIRIILPKSILKFLRLIKHGI